ncbi:MAG: hypothetical protein MJD61_10035 [Proteobacteria bacterium]|nr:hypothetical protein [Pseudomonadota bacterium]
MKLEATEPEGLLGRIEELASSVPECLKRIERELQAQGITHPTVATLTRSLTHRAATCRKLAAGG